MILIKEDITTKLPGITSLYITFDYNSLIVDIIKGSSLYTYDKDNKTWELPLTDLSYLLENLSFIDDIKILLLKDKKEKIKDYQLMDYKTNPYPYQLEGIQYGLNHDKYLLLDMPGLGKTLQIIYLAQELKEREGLEHCFIICGINTLKLNWKSEIEKHSDLTCRILGERYTKKGKYRVGSVKERLEDLEQPIDEFFVITNIQTLWDAGIMKQLTKKGKKNPNKFDMIVVDECHKLKGKSAQWTKNLLKLRDAKHRIGLTGTLLLNNPSDAFVPLSWIDADRSTFTNFKYYYYIYSGQFNQIFVGYKNLNILKDQLDKYSLRRTTDLLDLPEKNIINEYVDMNDKQAAFYDHIKEGIIDEVDKVKMSTANLLAMVTRLRQATACPAILTTENIPSSKIERACDLAEQIVENGDKVVIFSTFKESLNQIMENLAQYNPVLCTGDVKDTIIEENKEKFLNDLNVKVFCGTWQKCGTGLTLTSANYMIFLDTAWTQGEYEQNQDRIYRIGTKKPVFIYNLICKNTVDERVLQILEDKSAIADYIVDDKISEKGLNSLKKYIEELA